MIRHGIALYIADKELIGASPPRWWGLAYRQYSVRYSVLYPIPINIIVHYALKFYWLVYSWVFFGGWKDRLDDAYWQGYNEGSIRRDHHLDRLARIIMGKEITDDI